MLANILVTNNHLTVSFLNATQELVATSSSERNWKGMVIATLVILGVMGLILLSVVALTPDLTQPILGPKMNFGDFLSGNLDGSKFNGTWVSGERKRKKTLLIFLLCCSDTFF